MRTAASPPTTGEHGQDPAPDQDGRPFQVIVRPTPYAALVIGFAILATTGGVLAVAETSAASSLLERLWGLGWGLLLIGLFGGGAIVWLGQLIGRRPVLFLDEQGVRLPAVWPRPRSADRVLPWPHVSRVHAFTQVTSYRGGIHRQHHVAFVPVDNLGLRPPSRLERWAAWMARAPSPEALRYSVHVKPGWSATVEQIAEAAMRRKPGLRWMDERDLPRRRVRRWLRRHAARIGLATPPPDPLPRPHAPATPRSDPVEALTVAFAISLLLLVYWTPWLAAESWQQAHIDAHQVQVAGRIVDIHSGRHGTSVRATYTIGGRQVTSDAFDAAGSAYYPYLGKAVCVEVDATHPARARPCGTRGDMYAFQLWARVSGVATAVSGVLLLVARLLRRVIRRRGWSPLQTRTIALAVLFPAAAIVLAFWTPWLLLESHRQAQIDAHKDLTLGRIVAVDARPAIFGGRRATAIYLLWDWQQHRFQQVTTDPFPAPRYYGPGDLVCLEVDMAAPARARPCDTRGDVNTLTRWVVGSGVVTVVGGLLLAASWSARRRQPAKSV